MKSSGNSCCFWVISKGDSSTIVCSVKVKYAWCCCANLFNLPSQTLRIGGRVRKNCFCSNNRCSHKSSKSSSELWGKNICACSSEDDLDDLWEQRLFEQKQNHLRSCGGKIYALALCSCRKINDFLSFFFD